MKKLIDSPDASTGLRNRRNRARSDDGTPSAVPLTPETPMNTPLHFDDEIPSDPAPPAAHADTALDQALTLLELLPETPVPLPALFGAFFVYLFYSLIPLHIFISTGLLLLILVKQLFVELSRFQRTQAAACSTTTIAARNGPAHHYQAVLDPALVAAYASALFTPYIPTLQSSVTRLTPYIPPMYTSNLHVFMTSGTFMDRISPLFLYFLGYTPEELLQIIHTLPQDRQDFLLNSGGVLRLAGAPENVVDMILHPEQPPAVQPHFAGVEPVDLTNDLVMNDDEDDAVGEAAQAPSTPIASPRAPLAPPTPPSPPAPPVDFIGDTIVPIAINRVNEVTAQVTTAALEFATNALHSAVVLITPGVNAFAASMLSLSSLSLLPLLLQMSTNPRIGGVANALNRHVSSRVNPLVIAGLGVGVYGSFRVGSRWVDDLVKKYGGGSKPVSGDGGDKERG
jgi:hypothetical protein